MALQPIPFGSKPIAPIPFGSKPIAPVTSAVPAPTPAPGAGNSAGVTPSLPGQGDLLTQSASLASKILPVANLGKAVGGGLNALFQAVKTRSMAPITQQANENNANFGKVAGDAVQSVALPASLLAGGAEGAGAKAVASRVGVNAGLGSVLGGANAASNGGSASDVAGGAGLGAVLGGGLSGAGEALSPAVKSLPARLVRGALPKLAPGSEVDALSRIKVGTVASNLADHQAAVKTLGGQINDILASPTYAAHTGAGDTTLGTAASAFPNSNYTPDSIAHTLSGLVPEASKLVNNLQDGTATLAERNTLRQALDAATQKRFAIDPPALTAAKRVGAQVADTLRQEVQSSAPETKPVFSELSKELNLRNALNKAQQKIEKGGATLTLKDILSYMSGGLSGVLGERVAGSPGASLGAAKAISATSKGLPAANTLGRVLRPVIIPAATGAIAPQQTQ